MNKLILGIEFGSTRIKAALCDEQGKVLASGAHEWENDYIDGHWTYSLDAVKNGLQSSYKNLVANYGKPITHLDAIGISAMMHGYLAFDEQWNLLAPFRTWRDTTTSEAAEILTDKLQFNMPQRWSVSHFFQAVLNKEKHVNKVAHLQTLAGYVHYLLTGNNVLGIGDASGMFPTDNIGFDQQRIAICNGVFNEYGVTVDLNKILPTVMLAGQNAGTLTTQGAKYLDPTGTLQAGAICCPPEGDAGTGMVATNSVAKRTANVSAGTSAFLMAVLEKPLNNVYKEIDVVATPDGNSVAMVHVNNCTSEINAWVNLFDEVIALFGGNISKDKLFTRLFNKSLESDTDVGKLTAYNFLSGEPIANLTDGKLMLLRPSDGALDLSNFMQAQLFSAVATLRLGVDILAKERVALDTVCGHGGFFKTANVGQAVMSAALNAPITVMQNAGEGGAWGIALLAGYSLTDGITLQQYLNGIFANAQKSTVSANKKTVTIFNNFMTAYKANLPVIKLSSEIK